ncbi:hypothetical protein J6590_028333 [Homalodisca vitripennis]|nr:hypothetical protein J6590_028333 [Homalodisca vitripennis]
MKTENKRYLLTMEEKLTLTGKKTTNKRLKRGKAIVIRALTYTIYLEEAFEYDEKEAEKEKKMKIKEEKEVDTKGRWIERDAKPINENAKNVKCNPGINKRKKQGITSKTSSVKRKFIIDL